MSILIVDDEIDIRDSLRDILNMAGYDVITASNGKEAINYISEHDDISLMLVDMSMPEMTGEELLFTLEGMNKRPPTLVITALAPWKMIRLVEYGIGYIRKPINDKLLLGTIKTLIGKEGKSELEGSC